jgi:two-component system C4-dicarboxylate transport sensor histidine kinase DctB
MSLASRLSALPLASALAWLAIGVLSLFSAQRTHSFIQEVGYQDLSSTAVRRVDLYYSHLESELGKFEYLPSLLNLDASVRNVLQNSTDPALVDTVNRRLDTINRQARSTAIYVLNTQGTVVASSNWNDSNSLVGENLSFRPSFQDALHKGKGRFYAIGSLRGDPGYYFAHAIEVDGSILGIGMLEANLELMERNWWPGSERVLVLDRNGVVILSSVNEWKYKTVSPIAPDLLKSIAVTRQYNGREIGLLGLKEIDALDDGSTLVTLSTPTGQGNREVLFLARSQTIASTGWSVMLLAETDSIRDTAQYAGIGAGLAVAFTGLLAMHWRARRQVTAQKLAARQALELAYGELEHRVDQRTAELRQANQELINEVAERKRAEQVLLETQDELVQAGKMATLGQMSTGVTHELNQPLHALRTHCSNALQLLERNRLDGVERNLHSIIGLADRMSRITSQLRTFARKGTSLHETVLLARSIDNVMSLLGSRLQQHGMEVSIQIPQGLCVTCDASRLEQVFINLFANAIDATGGTPQPHLTVCAKVASDRVAIHVSDNGPGFPEGVLQRLFEPFFTTKPSGEGLGLGLVISASIVRAFGSELKARNGPSGGALFEFDLEHARNDEHA